MTPVEPLHFLTAVLPFKYTVTKLGNSAADRLSHLPPSHLLRSPCNQAMSWPDFIQSPMPLTCLLPPTFQTFDWPAAPGEQTWSHTRVRSFYHNPPSAELRTFILLSLLPPPLGTGLWPLLSPLPLLPLLKPPSLSVPLPHRRNFVSAHFALAGTWTRTG